MPETRSSVHIDAEVPDMEEGEGIGEVNVALMRQFAGETGLPTLCSEAGIVWE
ncbi:uncharacterized protein ARMOST_16136 [Armillaria ostoyae]|uniref:Uncharacterized protein n=1 Tax=Armillaria ostoyae TaxID=47428 RepID=A0A284RVF8_ARMOS|nr:uncharacterized protein ARMOST_16136 [Armillaria ostoyae]